MAKRRASKKQRKGREDQVGAGESLGLKPLFTIDISAHPHLLERVIRYSSPSTLAALLRCSRAVFQAAAPALYTTLRLTHQQFGAMIEAGKAPTKRGSTSGLLGRSFSPYLRECVKHTRYLHLLDYQPKVVLPPIPRGSFSNLVAAVIYPQKLPSRYKWPETPLALSTTGLDPLKPPHLIVRMTEKYILSTTYTLEDLHAATKRLTIILPFARHLTGLPRFITPLDTCSFIIVLLPPPADAPSSWRTLSSVNFATSFYNTELTLAGGEYFACDPAMTAEPPSALLRKWRSEDNPLNYMTFSSWLDEQDPGRIFTEAEEMELRAADRAVRATLAAEGKVF